MKKLAALIICGMLALNQGVYASEMNGKPIDVKVTVNGEEIVFPDQKPVLINERTLLPVRSVLESMGKTVSWEEATESIIISDDITTVKLRVGDFIMQQSVLDTVNNETYTSEIELDVAPVVINDRTCLPIRAIAEAFMATVDWEEETQTVLIVTADLLC